MATRIGKDYENRAIRSEYFWLAKNQGGVANWPHIKRAVESRLGQVVLREVQNFCWTTERAARTVRRVLGTSSRRDLGARAAPGETLPIGRTILFDVTNTHRRGAKGGISRTALKLAEQCRGTANTRAVVLADGKLREWHDDRLGEEVAIAPGDVHLIIDCFWDPYEEYAALIDRLRPAGLISATCFYDVIMVFYPFVVEDVTLRPFEAALPSMLERSEIGVTISRSSLEDLQAFAQRTVPDRQPAYGVFPLGADFLDDQPGDSTDFARRYGSAPLFLSVGTLEPKKGYDLTLDAADRLWADGHACNLMIIGRFGWCSNATAERIRSHPRFGVNLFWETQAGDVFLREAYRHAYCFVQASVGEGFGIPVVEAAAHGLPVICSDIDVFKEIAGDGIVYFERENSASLASAMREALATRPPVATIATITWRQSFLSLCEMLDAKAAEIVRDDATGRFAPPPRA